MIQNKDLKRRIIEISYKHKLSHLGSCLTAVDIIKEIYDTKKAQEPFILSAGHAGLALYVVLESQGVADAEKIFNHHGVHPDRCADCSLDCSTGSLGQGLPIATGMALADRQKDVYVLISDGEMAEGSIIEALNIRHDQSVDNLKVYLNYNGWGAYKRIDDSYFEMCLTWGVNLKVTNVEQLPFLKGVDAHYHVMTAAEYQEALELLK